ncbi:MAG: hypothetical protein K2L08_01305 [Erysipelotrichaceae bacterium]|nr:hypothetical protein [Erysipelotrichaceae bacterium]
MFSTSNTHFLNNRQRLWRGIIFGSLTAILCAILLTWITLMTHTKFSILYLLVGVIIAYSIRFFGKGVTIQFSILGGILTFLSILLTEIFIMHGFSILLYPSAYISAIMNVISSIVSGPSSFILLFFQIVAISIGFKESRVS